MQRRLQPPAHHAQGAVQPLDLIRTLRFSFLEGRLIECLWRAGARGAAAPDYEKAYDYLWMVREHEADRMMGAARGEPILQHQWGIAPENRALIDAYIAATRAPGAAERRAAMVALGARLVALIEA